MNALILSSFIILQSISKLFSDIYLSLLFHIFHQPFPMFFNRLTSSGYDAQFTSTCNPNTYPSSSNSLNFPRTNLLPSNHLEGNSHSNYQEMNSSTLPYQQPIRNPHRNFLNRTAANCPSNLSQRQQTRWFKTGKKAQANKHLLDNYEHFYWPTSYYDRPIYIHRFTPELLLQGMIFKLSKVHLFSVDTESDKPNREHSHTVPALIQIQAIYEQQWSTVLIIEVQHLPHRSSRLFHLIQTLCNQIFSSTNTIIGWGNVKNEFRAFEQFQLFNLNQLVNSIDLQTHFTNYWNQMHPHTTKCLTLNQPIPDEPEPDDVLICCINSTDLENNSTSINEHDDFDQCHCPDTIRPYKQKNDVWSLQKAIQHVFNQALDKAMTLNFWSCGLDLNLNTWQTFHDKETRALLTNYAINDVFAMTNLLFHIQANPIPSQHQSSSIQLNSIQLNPEPALPTLLLITDSHGKYFPPIADSSKFHIITKSISGLQWFNSFDSNLSLSSLVSSSTISSLLIKCYGVVFLVGTNSVRSVPAPHIIQQLDHLIDIIRDQHSHLTRQNRVMIISTFPCTKTSNVFPTSHLLMNNINQYNTMLLHLSNTKHFSLLTIPITNDHLHVDGMHIQVQHVPFIYNFIQQSIDLLLSNSNTGRSLEAKQRRNKKRHEKLRERQRTQTVVRPIAPNWNLHELKAYLKFKNINNNRLSEIRKHKLCLQFNHLNDQQYAEQALVHDEFSRQNYEHWLSMKR